MRESLARGGARAKEEREGSSAKESAEWRRQDDVCSTLD